MWWWGNGRRVDSVSANPAPPTEGFCHGNVTGSIPSADVQSGRALTSAHVLTLLNRRAQSLCAFPGKMIGRGKRHLHLKGVV